MSQPPASIPPLIEIYQAAHDRHDIGAALATFAEDAVVRDEDETWTGADQRHDGVARTKPARGQLPRQRGGFALRVHSRR